MTDCFKDHECDKQALNKNTKAISECKQYFTERNGRKGRVTEVPVLTCACIWRAYQKEAEEIVAPGGKLIADPKARNRAINAAYANLWLHDRRFQWAGLAAFASKQVGCGLLHASESMEKMQAEHEALERAMNTAKPRWSFRNWFRIGKLDEQAERDYKEARRNNPVPSADIRRDGESLSVLQRQYKHVYEMLAMGNTTLFLDVFPLHAFYKKRGLKELKTCLPARVKIANDPRFPILWPIGNRLEFGVDHEQILKAFEAIDKWKIAESVKFLAEHEQINILQPTMYDDRQLVALLRGNHLSYVTGFPTGVAEAIELTLTSQCHRVSDGRTIGFGDNPIANLADFNQRMPFVLKAAERFDQMLNTGNHAVLQQSIREISRGSR
ncbi:hypothetical protein PTE30175_03757 [Pandoraea terrae]|uniref:Uncharacterized protein n=1 Tax=Pandoraea terrae TaxID=1537710 RepID=A0A5E4XFH3_9BURK|nr:hypothetical protein [Pandoraea terrae]VVE35053.1 hypothetical protein PTE30175_03757 [Pandoraea terrae]